VAHDAGYLAIDLGASSGRAVVGTLDGERMGTREIHRFRTPLVEETGHLYWDIEQLWQSVKTSVGRAFEVTPHLRSVSIDSWAVDYVPLGPGGRLLRRPYAYRDPRTRGRLESILRTVDADVLYSTTGIQFLSFNSLPQILADIQDEPALVAKTATRLSIADYLLFRLSGVIAAERTIASTTQVYDVRTGAWADALIRVIGDEPARWPRIVDAGTVLGEVDRSLIPPGAISPVVVATCSHDTAAAVAAVPALGDEHWAYICSGTWSLVGVELNAPVLTPAARVAGFTNEVGLDNSVRFLKNRTGTWILEECVREWSAEGSAPTWDDLMHEAGAAARPSFLIDCNTPTFSERGAMVEKIAETCAKVGESAPTSRGALVRLVLESLADSYRETLSELESLSEMPIAVVHVVGGGSRNELLNQLTANACRRRVLAGPAEATALGNLLIQARAVGDLPAAIDVRDAARASSDVVEYMPDNPVADRGHLSLVL
jgi:rhamnulokinase